MEASIRVEGLSKRYRVCDAGPSYATLREALTSLASSFGSRRLSPREQRETWALRDVSFEVKTGEVVWVPDLTRS